MNKRQHAQCNPDQGCVGSLSVHSQGDMCQLLHSSCSVQIPYTRTPQNDKKQVDVGWERLALLIQLISSLIKPLASSALVSPRAPSSSSCLTDSSMASMDSSSSTSTSMDSIRGLSRNDHRASKCSRLGLASDLLFRGKGNACCFCREGQPPESWDERCCFEYHILYIDST